MKVSGARVRPQNKTQIESETESENIEEKHMHQKSLRKKCVDSACNYLSHCYSKPRGESNGHVTNHVM